MMSNHSISHASTFKNWLFALLCLTLPAVSAAGFRAAMVKVDITPTDSQYLPGYGAMTSDVKLRSSAMIVETPRKAGLGWTDDMLDYTGTTKEGVNLLKLPVRFLKINEDVAIWSAPLELFCEISNEIRDRSPFPYTMYFGYGNGWLGYLLTEKEYAQGGYETTVTPYSPKAGQDLTDAVMNYLQGEMKKP